MWCVFFCFIFYRHRFCLFSSVVLAHYSFYYSRLAQAKVESLLRVNHWQIDGTCYTSSQRLYVCKFKKHSLTLTASTIFYCCRMRYKSIKYAYLGSFFMKLYSRVSRKFGHRLLQVIQSNGMIVVS